MLFSSTLPPFKLVYGWGIILDDMSHNDTFATYLNLAGTGERTSVFRVFL